MLQHNDKSVSTLDKTIGKGKDVVSLSAFAYLYAELVNYHQSRVLSIGDLETELQNSGYGVGLRVLELYSFRGDAAGGNKRKFMKEVRVIGALKFVAETLWKGLFGKAADSLEKGVDGDQEYMIHEATPVTNHFVSVPTHLGSLNCASYIAGIVKGVLDGSGFACEVTAHSVDEGGANKTVFLLKFSEDVIARDKMLER